MINAKKILVVDDEPTICHLLRAFLATRGYEVFVAGNGKDALTCFEKERPDIVLLDISMPGMLGTEILEKIKALNANCGVIILSAYGDDQTIDEAIDKGAFCYIQKPMELMDLTEKLDALQATMT